MLTGQEVVYDASPGNGVYLGTIDSPNSDIASDPVTDVWHYGSPSITNFPSTCCGDGSYCLIDGINGQFGIFCSDSTGNMATLSLVQQLPGYLAQSGLIEVGIDCSEQTQ